MSGTAFITGASSGIGKATACLFAKKGINLILCARSEDKLLELKEKLSEFVKVELLILDLRDRSAIFEAVQSLDDSWKNDLSILVNNAGGAFGFDTFEHLSVDQISKTIDLNINGLIYVTKAILPILINHGKAHIVNVSSIAGKETYVNGSIYCATKHAVESISQSLRAELLDRSIKVTNIAPGKVETNFSLNRYDGDKHKAAEVYQDFQPLIAEDVADAIYYAISRPEHVQIADITILPKAQASIHYQKKNTEK